MQFAVCFGMRMAFAVAAAWAAVIAGAQEDTATAAAPLARVAERIPALVWLAAGYAGIDRLELATDHYWQFVADDLHFHII